MHDLKESLEQGGNSPMSDSKEIDYYYLENQYKMLAGKILTIIDASISGEQQNKCIKDLIKHEFFNKISSLQKLYWQGKQGHSVILETKDSDPLN